MKNFRSSASSSCKPPKIVVAFGEKPAQKPNSLSPRFKRYASSFDCANSGALMKRAKAIAKISLVESLIQGVVLVGIVLSDIHVCSSRSFARRAQGRQPLDRSTDVSLAPDNPSPTSAAESLFAD